MQNGISMKSFQAGKAVRPDIFVGPTGSDRSGYRWHKAQLNPVRDDIGA